NPALCPSPIRSGAAGQRLGAPGPACAFREKDTAPADNTAKNRSMEIILLVVLTALAIAIALVIGGLAKGRRGDGPAMIVADAATRLPDGQAELIALALNERGAAKDLRGD